MSSVHLPPALRSNAADHQSTVQKLLDENSRLIDIIREYQNQSRADEAIKHQQLLHRNLVHLSNLADPFLLNQLRDDSSPQTDSPQGYAVPPNQPGSSGPPHHRQQPQSQHSQQNHHQQLPPAAHHHPQMMPPQSAPSPSGPGVPMQSAHGFAPPPMNGPPDMMNHQAYQAQLRAQQQQQQHQQQNGPQPQQGYPPFGQPAPQMGGQRMPYPYPPQGMPGYPGVPPPHGYEGYPPPGAQPPQGYMR
ncbi:hypothetical protein GCK72_002289 [Caenorhabditis remanei]|uniref:SS18 N-terminal domain-containing protein n=1 Tax=Caenorhabditis remanei TaxID=31234 RepID=E3MGK8_CAERE|nr:hypothetical protein GCK72_002289 [Caenorhabditis remanei]EFP01436.1 hypothetical protein CRE_24025 [Caenorhabditis remanei]KAF1770470.1 hypothetical protein GCK72_002289 [Caenorhabditis remanei]